MGWWMDGWMDGLKAVLRIAYNHQKVRSDIMLGNLKSLWDANDFNVTSLLDKLF